MERQISGRFGRLRVRSRAALVAASAFLLLAACSGAQQADEAASPAPEPEISAPAAAPSPPATSEATSEPADATVSGVDYAFEVEDISAGDTVGFVNESDKEVHEMVVQRITDETVTLEDIQQLLEEDQEASPPAFLEDAGFAFAPPGETAAETVTLEAGRYLLLCFLPQGAPPELMAELMTASEEPELTAEQEEQLNGPPHATLGMLELVEVE